MRIGESLFFEGMRNRLRRITGYQEASWDDVLATQINLLSNTDDTGIEYEGRVSHVTRNGDHVEVVCEWVNRRKPYFDEDGDIDERHMYWESHSVLRTSFSLSDIPRRLPDGTGFIVGSQLDYNNFTLTKLRKAERFCSLDKVEA